MQPEDWRIIVEGLKDGKISISGQAEADTFKKLLQNPNRMGAEQYIMQLLTQRDDALARLDMFKTSYQKKYQQYQDIRKKISGTDPQEIEKKMDTVEYEIQIQPFNDEIEKYNNVLCKCQKVNKRIVKKQQKVFDKQKKVREKRKKALAKKRKR